MSNHCRVPKLLANIMLVYIIASFIYMIGSPVLGTPFKDSLSDKQKEIKKESAQKRSALFWAGVIIAIILLLLIKPFKDVKSKK